jgi:hypothetical protein
MLRDMAPHQAGVITDLAGLLVSEILSGELTEAAYHGIVFAVEL